MKEIDRIDLKTHVVCVCSDDGFVLQESCSDPFVRSFLISWSTHPTIRQTNDYCFDAKRRSFCCYLFYIKTAHVLFFCLYSNTTWLRTKLQDSRGNFTLFFIDKDSIWALLGELKRLFILLTSDFQVELASASLTPLLTILVLNFLS